MLESLKSKWIQRKNALFIHLLTFAVYFVNKDFIHHHLVSLTALIFYCHIFFENFLFNMKYHGVGTDIIFIFKDVV